MFTIMASSLVTLFPDEDVNIPYETLHTNTQGEIPSVVATGGVISNFQDVIIDNTILDVECTKVRAFPLNLPLPIQRVGGTTQLKCSLPIDNLMNSASLNITAVFSLNKRAEDGSSTPVVLADGIVPCAGYYPFSNISVSFDNSEIGVPDMQNLDLSILRNMQMMEKIKTGSIEELTRIHKTYAGFHLNHQSFENSKTGAYGAYTHTEGTHIITAVSDEKTGTKMSEINFNFQQRNIQQMLTGELIVTVELDNSFLNKTRIVPFIIKDATFELHWANPGNIFAQEAPVPTAKDGVWDSLHFVLKNCYYSYQNVLASPELITSYSSLTNKVGDTDKDVISNLPIAYPSWIIKNIHRYDVASIPSGQSSILLSLKGRQVPETLIIIFRRKSMINSKIGNYRYLDFPCVTNIVYSSPTYSHLKYLESDRGGISMFHKVLEDVNCLSKFDGKTRKMKARIMKQLDYLIGYPSRAMRNISLEGSNDLITSPDIIFNGGAIYAKSYRRAVMAGKGVRSKPVLADLRIEFTLGKATEEELQVECFGSVDGILSVQPDRSFRMSLEDSGTPVKQSIAIHETMSKNHEDLNLRVSNI